MKVGIVGASFARAAYLPALRHVRAPKWSRSPRAASRARESAAEAFGVPHAYDDWRRDAATSHALDLV